MAVMAPHLGPRAFPKGDWNAKPHPAAECEDRGVQALTSPEEPFIFIVAISQGSQGSLRYLWPASRLGKRPSSGRYPPVSLVAPASVREYVDLGEFVRDRAGGEALEQALRMLLWPSTGPERSHFVL